MRMHMSTKGPYLKPYIKNRVPQLDIRPEIDGCEKMQAQERKHRKELHEAQMESVHVEHTHTEGDRQTCER